ncbi:MAG: hypothetical protein V1679_00010 [Candidatus Peregrinibacteria bacterium]
MQRASYTLFILALTLLGCAKIPILHPIIGELPILNSRLSALPIVSPLFTPALVPKPKGLPQKLVKTIKEMGVRKMGLQKDNSFVHCLKMKEGVPVHSRDVAYPAFKYFIERGACCVGYNCQPGVEHTNSHLYANAVTMWFCARVGPPVPQWAAKRYEKETGRHLPRLKQPQKPKPKKKRQKNWHPNFLVKL